MEVLKSPRSGTGDNVASRCQNAALTSPAKGSSGVREVSTQRGHGATPATQEFTGARHGGGGHDDDGLATQQAASGSQPLPQDAASQGEAPAQKAPSPLATLWHAHLDPLDPQGPARARTAEERQAWESFRHIKETVPLRVSPASRPLLHPSNSHTPRPVPWFHPSLIPSPTAFYFWRRENARRLRLEVGSLEEVLLFKYLVALNYEAALHDRIILDQHSYEASIARQVAHAKPDLDHSSPAAALPQHQLSVFTGVAEAELDGTAPSDATLAQFCTEDAWAKASNASRNRKAFPASFYLERSRFQEEWNQWCRLNGSNEQNHLFDFAHYASHNSYSLYHKAKYGEWGSPHPYVPFAIMNPEEFTRSRQEQVRQELDAVKWVQQRRSAAATQEQLSRVAATMQAERGASCPPDLLGTAAATAVGRQPIPPSAELLANSRGAAIPLVVPDDVVVDQEIEQPEAMGCQRPVDNATADPASVPTQQAAPSSSASATTSLPSLADPSEVTPVTMPVQNVPSADAALLTSQPIAVATSITNPITVSVIVPDNLLPWIRRELYHQLHQTHPSMMGYWLDDTTRRLPWPKEVQPASSSFARLRPSLNVPAVVTDDELPWRSGDKPVMRYDGDEAWATDRGLAGAVSGPRWSSRSLREEPPAAFQVGNLFLSSCPGKKVRLTGAVRGRGAVCRDLGLDLKRFQELGVGTLVCCLSDSELDTIGVQWSEYLYEADCLGLDLIRVPMMEGNCPTSLELLDAWLNEIIVNCTLKGVNVLVHCRGGVGRAGTLAACWLIKMGFVDEFRSEAERSARGHTWPCQELLWQCLQVVRLRRSAKAIETAEQAAFVASYAQYVLDQEKKRDPAVAPLGLPHCQMVEDYWERMRLETKLWVARQAGDGSEQGASGPTHTDAGDRTADGGATTTTVPAAAAAVNGHTSNINARHAAQVKLPVGGDTPMPLAPSPLSSSASSTSSSLGPEAGDVAANATRPQESVVTYSDPSVQPSDSTPMASQGSATERGDGEPSRKRRNTLTTMAGIRLSDTDEQHSQSAGVDPRTGVDHGTSSKAEIPDDPVQTMPLQQQKSRLVDDEAEAEMDAFPVNGRREWDAPTTATVP
ncbi:unnamed protein product [Parajaminaea phylloscopi]